jgi:hypothetical protein
MLTVCFALSPQIEIGGARVENMNEERVREEILRLIVGGHGPDPPVGRPETENVSWRERAASVAVASRAVKPRPIIDYDQSKLGTRPILLATSLYTLLWMRSWSAQAQTLRHLQIDDEKSKPPPTSKPDDCPWRAGPLLQQFLFPAT